MHPHEWLDLVDENDQVIGKKLRADIYAEELHNYRVIHAFIKNSKGQLWIPRRTADKVLSPLGLDFSVAGHVESGESYDDAFKREAQEEANLDITTIPHKVLGKITPRDGGHAFEMVYELELDEAPDYNPEDFIEYFWLYPQEVVDKIAAGDKAKGAIVPTIKRFYLS